jgi:hypothetical protein
MYSKFFGHVILCRLVAIRAGVELVSVHGEVGTLIGLSSDT